MKRPLEETGKRCKFCEVAFELRDTVSFVHCLPFASIPVTRAAAGVAAEPIASFAKRLQRFGIVATLALMLIPAAAAKEPDPRVCDMYNQNGPAEHAKQCTAEAASILAWKATNRAIGAPTPWAPQCVATKMLHYRCFLRHGLTSGPAVSVWWDSATFKPTVTFGQAGVAYVAAAKARVAAVRASDG